MTKSYTADNTTAKKMAKSFVGWRLTRGNNIFIYISLLALVTIFSFSWHQPFIIAVSFFVLLAGEFTNYKKVKNLLAQNIAKPGNKISASITQAEIIIKTSQSSSKTALNFFKSVEMWGGYVFLKGQNKILVILPSQLISGESFEILRNAIDAERSKP